MGVLWCLGADTILEAVHLKCNANHHSAKLFFIGSSINAGGIFGSIPRHIKIRTICISASQLFQKVFKETNRPIT